MRGQANKELSEASACHIAVNVSCSAGEDSEGSPLEHVAGRLPGSLGRWLLEEAQITQAQQICSPSGAQTCVGDAKMPGVQPLLTASLAGPCWNRALGHSPACSSPPEALPALGPLPRPWAQHHRALELSTSVEPVDGRAGKC